MDPSVRQDCYICRVSVVIVAIKKITLTMYIHELYMYVCIVVPSIVCILSCIFF